MDMYNCKEERFTLILRCEANLFYLDEKPIKWIWWKTCKWIWEACKWISCDQEHLYSCEKFISLLNGHYYLNRRNGWFWLWAQNCTPKICSIFMWKNGYTGNEMGTIWSDMDVIILWKYLHEMRNLHPNYEQNEMYSGVRMNIYKATTRTWYSSVWDFCIMLCVCSVTRSDIDINERKLMLAAGVRDVRVCSFVT